MFLIKKSITEGFKFKYKVKAFKTIHAMGDFLCSKENYSNSWSEVEEGWIARGMKKAGIYVGRGNDFLDTKKIPPSLIAHF